MTGITRRGLVAGAGLATLGPALATPALAQAGYPSRNVTIIAPVAPGSQSDIFARILSAPLAQRLGRPVIVENRPGGGGIVGTQAAVRAAPDGHTLMLHSSSGSLVAPQLRRPPPYVTPRDLVAVAVTLSGPSVIVVNPAIRATTIQELVAELKANPGRFNLGSHGVGAFSHVAMELFMAETGTQMVHSPYNGGGPLAAAFAAGDVHVVLFDILTARPFLASGQGRPLAVVGERPATALPEVPLVSETVAPAVNMDYWFGVFAPAGTPEPIVERLNAEIAAIMGTPEYQARATEASMLTTPQPLPAIRARVEKEWDDWARVIRERNIVSQ
ncbi:Bug family tripartite tricarboxylate transporter substrate binding protein [Falsiroseomonas ponticola]|uniref:Bug family tripartite tricarboxylate transporter substrate binding protein n=1 Tax=Falsiroseomonas ponticola TaxID=2786951 RepID=UPI0019321C5D|nr:tripartite tricarboxylate transporter substrate binding protein [Roseomonas ponticola]